MGLKTCGRSYDCAAYLLRPEGPDANVFIIVYESNEPSSDTLLNSAITSSKRVLLKKKQSKIFKIYDRFTVDGKLISKYVASSD